MARRRRRMGALRHHAGMMPKRGTRRAKVSIMVERNVGAANARAYIADACFPKGRHGLGAKTCGTAAASTPTKAVARSLHALAKKTARR